MTQTKDISWKGKAEHIHWDLRRGLYSLHSGTLYILLVLQLASFLLVHAKGAGAIYADIILLLIAITLLGWMGTAILHGNRKIYTLMVGLFTVGTMLQSIFRAEGLEKNVEPGLIHSSTFSLQLQYVVAMAAGVAAALVYRKCSKIASDKWVGYLMVISVLISLVTLLLGGGDVKNWIHLGGLSIQTTELVKLFYIFIASSLLGAVKKPGKARILTFCIFTLIEMGLFVVQGEYGTLLLIAFVFLAFLFLFVEDLRYFGCAVTGSLASGVGFAFLGKMVKGWNTAGSFLGTNPVSRILLKGYNKIANRVIYWLHPENDALGLGYQLIRAKKSILLGGWFGTSSITDLPVKTSDLVYPALIQRCGMVFAIVVFVFFVLFFLEGMKLAVRKQDPYHRMVASGLVCMLFAQAVIIIGGSTGLCPLTGITLPFISSGGTSLMISFMMVGILIALSGDVSWEGTREDEETTFFKKNANLAKLYAGARHAYDVSLGKSIRNHSGDFRKGGRGEAEGKAGDL